MSSGVEAAIVLGVIYIGFAKIIQIFTDYRIKRKLIDTGHVDEKISNLLSHKEDNYQASLKWGMVIFFGGLGLIVLEFIPYRPDSPFPYGLEAMFIAAGFLAYYFFIRKELVRK